MSKATANLERLNRKWLNVLLFIASFLVVWELGMFIYG